MRTPVDLRSITVRASSSSQTTIDGNARTRSSPAKAPPGTSESVRDEATFRRVVIHGNDNLLFDLALDSPP